MQTAPVLEGVHYKGVIDCVRQVRCRFSGLVSRNADAAMHPLSSMHGQTLHPASSPRCLFEPVIVHLYMCMISALVPSSHIFSPPSLHAQTVKAEGWQALFRGLSFTLVRAAPVASAVLPVYDIVHAKLSEWDEAKSRVW